MPLTRILIALLAFLMVVLPVDAQANTVASISIAAPKALRSTLNELVNAWKTSGGDIVTVSYDDSDDQAVEIEMAATTYDLFIVGDSVAIHRVMSNGKGATMSPLASTSLVLVASNREKAPTPSVNANLVSLLGTGRLAICDPQSDAVGGASRGVLSESCIWKSLQDHLLILPDSPAVIRAVQSGDARFGITLRSDLLHVSDVHEGSAFTDGTNPEFTYFVIGIVGRQRPEVRRFLAFLHSRESVRAIVSHGFTAIAQQD
ncbi:MAG: molybdate ABC transporter substrate-binding protein [Alphaproteobacteria bacterium]